MIIIHFNLHLTNLDFPINFILTCFPEFNEYSFDCVCNVSANKHSKVGSELFTKALTFIGSCSKLVIMNCAISDVSCSKLNEGGET